MDGPAVEVDDPAARAFEGVRAEVALLRRAVEGLAAERAGIELPDYAPTLAQIAQAVRTTVARLDRMSASPALAISPEEMVSRIEAASSAVRAQDHAMIESAGTMLDRTTRQLADYIASARRDDQQNRWLLGTGAGGVAVGLLMWATFAGPIVRAVPANWHWREERAARALDLSMRQAGEQLLATDDPVRWQAMVAASQIVRGNREAIERCRKAATQARKVVRCTISISAAEAR